MKEENAVETKNNLVLLTFPAQSKVLPSSSQLGASLTEFEFWQVDLTELVDFFIKPGKFKRSGARIPKGVLLCGPPGTGKTLLARAVAGEARVAFLSLNASEFVEMFAGLGASRVRDLFNQVSQSGVSCSMLHAVSPLIACRSCVFLRIVGSQAAKSWWLKYLIAEVQAMHTGRFCVSGDPQRCIF